MDSEMFTTGGYGEYADGGGWLSAKHPVTIDAPKLDEHLKVAQVKFLHAVKMLAYIAMIVTIIYCAVMFVFKWIPDSVKLYKSLSGEEEQKNGFTQWLGASTNVVRGDYENNADSLAEKAVKADGTVTDISTPVKQPYRARERYMSPEEELMKKQSM